MKDGSDGEAAQYNNGNNNRHYIVIAQHMFTVFVSFTEAGN